MMTRRFTPLAVCCSLALAANPVCEADRQSPRAMESQDTQKVAISRARYEDRLHGFWLGQCIANWTGLTTEMDRVEAPFYTDEDWGKADEPNVWGKTGPSPSIDFFLTLAGKPWGADDDTDIEYMYQRLLYENETAVLSPKQIREGWLRHMWSDNFNEAADKNNFLWVSNESAFELMREGVLPPETSDPERNPNFDMIDAQLTTEIFGLFAPGRPDVALEMAKLPIATTARENARWAAEFYVVMHSLAAVADEELTMKERVLWLGEQARERCLPDESYVASMYDFVRSKYEESRDPDNWEAARDALYERYQVGGAAGYRYQQPFDAGINFGASLVSLFYGEGDLKRTIQIGALAGWDSDNPTATWGGLLGFLLGKEEVEAAFGSPGLSDTYWIHRTRRGFFDWTPAVEGEDVFPLMAQRGVEIVDRVVVEEIGGTIDAERNVWVIPVRSRFASE